MNRTRLALGTVQFGQPYGVANTSGQVQMDEARTIITQAWMAGIDTLDTAIAYGGCEGILGEIGVDRWHVVTKLPEVPGGDTSEQEWIMNAVRGSLERLNIDQLHAILLHRPQQLLESNGEDIHAALLGLKEDGMVEKWGVSIYHPEELDSLWSLFRPDLVQAPFNILDRRIQTTGWLGRMKRSGTEVHVRSIFLQGLLLMSSDRRPGAFHYWQNIWDEWDHWLESQKLTPVQACLGFALSRPEIDRVIVGVDSHQQLMEILDNAETRVPDPPRSLATDDINLINPSRWTLS